MMKRILQIVSVAALVFGLLISSATTEEKNVLSSNDASKKCHVIPIDLRVEHLESPKGLDVKKPRFSWKLAADHPHEFGQKQTAYQIKVWKFLGLKDTEEKIQMIKDFVWDSGWVESDQMQLIEYQGKPLESDFMYYYGIYLKDENGNVAADFDNWTTGLFHQSEWTAKWIGSDELFDVNLGLQKGDCNISDPWLRKTFELKEKPKKANLFVASVGYHAVYVNGEQIDDPILAPAVTDHTKRARYVTYDIAKYLKPGKNVIALWLGTSWSIFPGYQTENLPRTPIVCAQADFYNEISDTKPVLRLQTDETWKTHSSPNKLLGTWDFGNMGGEIWNANKEIPDWNQTDFDDSTWKNVTVYHPNLKLSAQRVEKNELYEKIHPVSIEKRGEGIYRFDMGVNFAGWTNIKLTGEPGMRIDILFSERRQDEMTFRNRSAYIMGPSGKGMFHNCFNYSSGRWITVRGLKKEPTLDDVCGWNIHTGFDRVGQFECSDELQNWIYDRVCWTFENLSLGGFVVDCPQRERMGYGGDVHATSETAMLNYRLGAFYTKWLEDWRDVQGTEPMVGNMNDPKWARKETTSGRIFNNGIQPHTAPTYWGGGGPTWGGIC
jgi:alpha-L-rhamnosidase